MSDADPAKRRVAILLTLRLAGAAVMMLGVARWLKGHGEPNPIAAAIMLVGFVLLLALPWALVKRWKRPG